MSLLKQWGGTARATALGSFLPTSSSDQRLAQVLGCYTPGPHACRVTAWLPDLGPHGVPSPAVLLTFFLCGQRWP